MCFKELPSCGKAGTWRYGGESVIPCRVGILRQTWKWLPFFHVWPHRHIECENAEIRLVVPSTRPDLDFKELVCREFVFTQYVCQHKGLAIDRACFRWTNSCQCCRFGKWLWYLSWSSRQAGESVRSTYTHDFYASVSFVSTDPSTTTWLVSRWPNCSSWSLRAPILRCVAPSGPLLNRVRQNWFARLRHVFSRRYPTWFSASIEVMSIHSNFISVKLFRCFNRRNLKSISTVTAESSCLSFLLLKWVNRSMCTSILPEEWSLQDSLSMTQCRYVSIIGIYIVGVYHSTVPVDNPCNIACSLWVHWFECRWWTLPCSRERKGRQRTGQACKHVSWTSILKMWLDFGNYLVLWFAVCSLPNQHTLHWAGCVHGGHSSPPQNYLVHLCGLRICFNPCCRVVPQNVPVVWLALPIDEKQQCWVCPVQPHRLISPLMASMKNSMRKNIATRPCTLSCLLNSMTS